MSDTKRLVQAMAGHIAREQTDFFLEEILRHAPWDVWADKLAQRKRPEPLHKLIATKGECPLSWSLTENASAESRQLLDELYQLRRRPRKDESVDWTNAVSQWLEAAHHDELTTDQMVEMLAWAHSLPRLAPRCIAEVWSALWAHLVNAASSASPVDVANLTLDNLWWSQLLAVELPLTLAYQFPKVERCEQLLSPARNLFERSLIGLLDGEGVLHGRLGSAWRGLLACWTRCLYLDRKLVGERISKDARLQYEWLVRQSIRWSRADNTLILSHDWMDANGLLTAAVELGGDRVDRDLLSIHQGRKKPNSSQFSLPLAGEHSEWAEQAILRSNWAPDAHYLAVNFSEGRCASEFSCQGLLIWSGLLTPQVRFNGTPLESNNEWEEVCWESNEHVDYLELQMELGHEWLLQRQIMLAREDNFLWFSDALLGSHAGRVEYQIELPLNAQVQCVEDPETTEIQLVAPRWLSWAMPLALSEWRTDRRAGQFDGRTLTQTADGTALYCPLFFDLDAARRRKPRTWRQLTIAENLEILPRDVAVAYRVHVDEQQWVFYRSLGPTGNRTFLGHNLISEFFAARFNTSGEIEDMIEIETQDDEE